MEQSLYDAKREIFDTARPAVAHNARSGTQGSRLLLVDDEKMILKTFSLMLSDLGYSLKTASNSRKRSNSSGAITSTLFFSISISAGTGASS